MGNADNVTTGKPKIGGALSNAPLGTDLPTDAATALAEAYKPFGYCDDSGLTQSTSTESSETTAWGGDIVLSEQTSKAESFKVVLIEALNTDVLKFVKGAANVTGTLATGITIKNNSSPLEPSVIISDMRLKGGVLKRIVIPNGKLSEVGDVVYVDGDPVGYEVTIAAMPDAEGNTSYEYIKAPAQG